MILGAAGELALGREQWAAGKAGAASVGGSEAAATVLPWGVATLDREGRHAVDPASGSWLVFSGTLFSDRAARDGLVRGGPAEALLARLAVEGPTAVASFEGTFAIAWWDRRSRKLWLLRDAFGIEPLFYAEAPGGLAFGSRVGDVLAAGARSRGLSAEGLAEFLVWGYVPGQATLDEGIRKVAPGSWVAFESGGRGIESARWHRLSYAAPWTENEEQIAGRFRELLRRAVERRLPPPPVGALLSGGMDSSSIVTFARRRESGAIRTFAFRCAGASFDESFYARGLAAELGTEHREVSYGEEQALQKEDAVREMDVPFCDIGIVTASWLLGAAAEGQVSTVLTGDGGDELWGSHPVYSAQKIVRLYERLPIPRGVTRGLERLAALLPDTRDKRDLRVKLKKILPPGDLPRALGPFRWRAYSSPARLAELLTPEAHEKIRGEDPFHSVLEAYAGYDGPDDGLSAYLYNDYRTTSSFYFNRLRLLRRFGIEARCPFYDTDLVTYGARIPARLKLEGIERTKRLFRAAMNGILPDVVNARKDKLGHSVPLKNWLRGTGPLRARLDVVLSPESVHRRGLFRPDAVQRLKDEHARMRHNHSHRLWSLYVLEVWLRARETSGSGTWTGRFEA